MPFFATSRLPHLLLPVLFSLSLTAFAHGTDSHTTSATQEAEHHNAHQDEHTEAHTDSVTIPSDMAAKAGITTRQAGAGAIARYLPVYGRLALPPTAKASLRARFPGIVTELAVSVGERVEAGQLLAKIEANSSFTTYALRAPFAGQVQTIQTAPGEATGERILTTLINSQTLVAELRIFPSQQAAVTVGQTVVFDAHGTPFEGQVDSIPPSTQATYAIARVTLDNPHGQLLPGQLVKARIRVRQQTVSLRVANSALQQLEGHTVVFVKHDNQYIATPVTLGLRDATHSQVLSGLEAGDEYVATNSYLLKADLLKAGAAHNH